MHIDVRRPGSTFWKGLSKIKCILKENISWSIGNGRDLQFWEDEWLGGKPFIQIPNLFDLARWGRHNVGGKAQCHMDDSIKLRSWKILRPLGHDLSTVAKVVYNILAFTPLPLDNDLDISRCKLGKGGMYKVTWGYLALLDMDEDISPIKKIWIKGVTSKVTYYLWLVFRKRILTIDKLRKRG